MWVSGFAIAAEVTCNRLETNFNGKVRFSSGEISFGQFVIGLGKKVPVPSRSFITVCNKGRAINGANK